MKRCVIHVGGYGSGKTELSLNTAIKWADEGRQVVLVDLDIVNPYFRSAEQGALLRQHGIRLVAPTFANTTLDVPALPAEVYGVFEGEEDIVFDVGGDPVGASALGRYAHLLKDAPMFMVVNIRRPLTGTVPDILEMMEIIQARARLPIAGLVNNANLALETKVSDLLEGQAMLEEVSQRTGLPILAVTGMEPVIRKLPEHLRELALPLTLYTRPDWL